jgi:hypothetical protein
MMFCYLWISAGFHSSTEEMEDVLCRVMSCNQDSLQLKSFQSLIMSANPETFAALSSDQIQSDRDVISRCQSSRRCLTSKRLLGQVPHDTREGDCVMIVLGAVVPFILRSCEDRYQMVGQAYIHGIMKGEALEFGKELIEDIELV